jgi:hypothetical protein
MRIGTQLARILILERDLRPGRTTIILTREPIGIWHQITGRHSSPKPESNHLRARNPVGPTTPLRHDPSGELDMREPADCAGSNPG